MNNKLDQIYAFIDSRQDEMLTLWEEAVRMESSAREPENVNKLGEYLKKQFEKEGFECELVDVGTNGKTLVGTLGADRKEKPVIFSGHMDTVYPTGSFSEEVFKIEDGKAFGPGVLDMKGGIIISLFVIKALNHIGYNERPIKIIISGDEEIAHKASKGSEVILKEAVGGICAFNMETGLTDNSLCVGRKGGIGCHVTVDGVGSHAGNDFTSGINAIEEMAHKILAFQKLTDLDSGITVSVGKITGGTVSNAIPAQCKIEIDIRFVKTEDVDVIKGKIEEVCATTYLDGTTTTFEYVYIMAAYETTDDVLRFYDFVNETSKEYGFGEMGNKKLGGGSDASYITIAKTPVLCSFGVQGQWNHTKEEYAIVESLYTRTKLISTIIMNLSKFK